MNNKDQKTEYWELMMEENYEKAFPLRELNFPKYCYKYRKLDQTTINTIKRLICRFGRKNCSLFFNI